MLNKVFYILDRPLLAVPLAIVIGVLAGIIDHIARQLIEAAAWGML